MTSKPRFTFDQEGNHNNLSMQVKSLSGESEQSNMSCSSLNSIKINIGYESQTDDKNDKLNK